MSIGRHTVYNISGRLAPVAVMLVTIPLYLKVVGVDRYAILGIAWLLLGYFGVFDLGLSRAAAYRIALLGDRNPRGQAIALWSALAVVGALSFVGGIVLYFAGLWYFSGPFNVADQLRGEVLQALPWVSMALPSALIANLMMGALNGREKFAETNAVNAIATISTQAMPLAAALLFEPTLPILIAASFFVRLLTAIVWWFRCRSQIIRGVPMQIDGAEVRELVSFGGWVSFAGLIAPLMTVFDRLLLGWLMNATAVATYSVPSQLAQRANIVPLALGSAIFPRLTSLSGNRQSRDLVVSVTHAIAVIMVPVLVLGILAMWPFLKLWLGGKFGYEAAVVGQIILFAHWFISLSTASFAQIQAGGNPKRTAIIQMCEVPPYIIALIFLTSKFGLAGTAAAFALRSAGDYLILNRITSGTWKSSARYIIPTLIVLTSIILAPFVQINARGIAIGVMIVSAASAWSLLHMPVNARNSLKQMYNASFVRKRGSNLTPDKVIPPAAP